MIFYVMRHGETVAPHRFCGRIDVALSEHGINQTKEAITKLAQEPIEIVYSTGLQRTDNAAKMFLKLLAVPHVVDKRFIELNFGVCEGLRPEEINQKYPEIAKQYLNTGQLHYPEGENINDLVTRVSKGLNAILKTEKNSLLITHNGVIRAIHMCLSGDSFDACDAKTSEIFKFEL